MKVHAQPMKSNMKTITNTSLQSWSLPMRTAKGLRHVYLEPKSSVDVPTTYITEDVIRYEKRKLITIRNA